VAVVHDGMLSSGAARSFALDVSGLGAGLYVLRVRGEFFEDSRRLVVAR
jgi:hypothetical protein